MNNDNESTSSDPALEAPVVNTTPGREYADETRVYTLNNGIERAANGRLWADFMSGGPCEGRWNWHALVTSDDDGRTWSCPKFVIDPPGWVCAHVGNVWHDPEGRLWWFWTQAMGRFDGRSGVWTVTTDQSGSENPTWSRPRRLCNGTMLNKPTVLSTGEWLICSYVDKAMTSGFSDMAYAHDLGSEDGTNVYCSIDRGETFGLLGQVSIPQEKRRGDEHMIVEKTDGTLWLPARTAEGIGESFSSDRGKTWDTFGPSVSLSRFSHPTSRFFIRRLRSGRLLVVLHDPPGDPRRTHLTAYLSDDDGESWHGGLLLDDRGTTFHGCSYPDGVEAPDGTIYVTYDHERHLHREILLAVFTEADVAAGKWVSDRARSGVLVNKATGTQYGAGSAGSSARYFSANDDGEELFECAPAVVEAVEGTAGILASFRATGRGSPAFSDLRWEIYDLPRALENAQYLCSPAESIRAVCLRDGVATILTPRPRHRAQGIVPQLLETGFVMTNIPEFLLTRSDSLSVCSVFQKRVVAGDRIDLRGRYGVLVADLKKPA
jgi:hypothetical protein